MLLRGNYKEAWVADEDVRLFEVVESFEIIRTILITFFLIPWFSLSLSFHSRTLKH